MNYNFSDQARGVIARAREEAIRLGHDYVGTEHILLGIVRGPRGRATGILLGLSVDLEMVRVLVEQSVPEGRSQIARGELPYTSRAKKVLEFALSEGRELNHSMIGSEHLLLGLLREEKGIAAEILNRVGVTLEGARRKLLELLASSPDDPAESITDPNQLLDEVIVVHLTNGETHRVREARGPSARAFVETIARRGVWITGDETFYVPPTAIARIQIYTPEEWARSGSQGGSDNPR